MLNVISKTLSKTKTFLKNTANKVTNLRLRYKILGAAGVVLCAAAIVVTIVLAQPNAAAKVATVVHKTTATTQKVKAADTAKPADQPAAPAPSTTPSTTAPAAQSVTPNKCGGNPNPTVDQVKVCGWADRVTAPSTPAPTAPAVTFTPATVTYNILSHDNLYLSATASAASNSVTRNNAITWAYNDPSGNFVATFVPFNAVGGASHAATIQFAYPSFSPAQAGSYPITVTATDTVTGLSSSAVLTIVATAN